MTLPSFGGEPGVGSRTAPRRRRADPTCAQRMRRRCAPIAGFEGGFRRVLLALARDRQPRAICGRRDRTSAACAGRTTGPLFPVV
jgi:hypothetical protein